MGGGVVENCFYGVVFFFVGSEIDCGVYCFGEVEDDEYVRNYVVEEGVVVDFFGWGDVLVVGVEWVDEVGGKIVGGEVFVDENVVVGV